jgi:hypothetical protein
MFHSRYDVNVKVAFSFWKCEMILETESEERGDVKGNERPHFASQRNRSAGQ